MVNSILIKSNYLLRNKRVLTAVQIPNSSFEMQPKTMKSNGIGYITKWLKAGGRIPIKRMEL
jgi:hypothetical protein